MTSSDRCPVCSPKLYNLRESYFAAVLSSIPKKLSHVQTKGNDESLKSKTVFCSRSFTAEFVNVCSLTWDGSRLADSGEWVLINRRV